MVVGMRERSKPANQKGRTKGKVGRVKFVHVPDAKKESIKASVDANVSPCVDGI